MTDIPNELLPPEDVGKKSADTRMRDADGARSLVRKVIQEDEPRSRMRAVVKGMIDGNPPYREGARRAAGLEWTCNLNFMGGKAIMDKTSVPYYQLFNGVTNYAETRTAYQSDNPDHERWCNRIALRFHQTLKRWKGFDWNMQQCSYQMRLHGLGPYVFDRVDNWRFRAVESGNLLAPQGSASCIDERIPYLVLRVAYRAHELAEDIQDEKSASALGYDVECVKEAIKYAARNMASAEGYNWSVAPWEMFQKMLKNQDLNMSYTKADLVYCAHMFVMEYTGKVSHFIMTENAIVPDEPYPNNEIPTGKYLFKHPNRYDNYDEAIGAFFKDIGDGTWHSVRGYASDAFKHLESENRLMCRALDGAFIESSLVLQAPTQKVNEKLQLMQIGPVTFLPPGVTNIQSKLAGFLDGPITMMRVLQNNRATNIGQQAVSLSREDGRGEVPTATQINQQVTQDSSLNQGQMILWYLTADRLYDQIFARLADPKTSDEEAKRFQRLCREDGVPPAALRDMEYVRANRASGYGSPQMRVMTDQQMMPLVPMLPEDGKQNYLEDAVAGIKGADKVERYVPRRHIPQQDDTIAALENAMIAGGRTPEISAGQNDVIHLHSHLGDAANTLEPVKEAMDAEQADPQMLTEAFDYIQAGVPHYQQHLARINADPTRKGQAKLFEQQLQYIVGFHGKLRGALRQAQREAAIEAKQQQQATALSALDEARVQSMQTQMANATAKTANSIENSRLKTLNSIGTNRVKLVEQVKTDRIKTAHELALAQASTEKGE